jgi:hypothetical protein
MNQVAKSYGFLRISGEALVPKEISKRLGCEPTRSFQKGDDLADSKKHPTRIATSGVWEVDMGEADWDEGDCNDLEGQIKSLFARMSSIASVWRTLQSEFDIELFIDIEVDLAEEFILSREMIEEFASRGVQLLFVLECISTNHSIEKSQGKMH